jgi:hypothetical protein
MRSADALAIGQRHAASADGRHPRAEPHTDILDS